MGAGETTFGPFVLDRGRMALLQAGRPVALGQRGLALLSMLADRDDVVTKAELMEAGWPGVTVEEGNLTVQIAALRKALGPREDGQEWIVTVPRVGYRLVRGQVAGPPPARLPSLAVLPFANLSGDPEQDYFADGVVDDIITALSRFRSFAVIARNSSFVYKGRAVDVRDVATELGVRYVLEGSVRRAGARLRIVAQLIDGASGAHIWADTFDGTAEDIFDMQDRITESVVALVEPQIQRAEIERSREERPGSLAAYDLYLRALPKLSGSDRDNADAYTLFQQALALEPGYARALAEACAALGVRIVMGWPPLTPDDQGKCIELADAALTNAAGDAAVLIQVAMMQLHVAHDYERGMLTVERALAANPNNLAVLTFAGIGHLHCGDLDKALAYSQQALRLSPGDPESHNAMTTIAHAHLALGDYDEALRWAERAHAVNAKNNFTYWMLIAANAQLGRLDAAQRYLAEFRAIVPGTVTVAGIRDGQPWQYPDRMANILDGLKLAGLPER